MEAPRWFVPRVLAPAFAQWSLDVRTVFQGLNGHRPVPFTVREAGTRHTSAPPAAAAVGGLLNPRALRVEALTRETHDTVSVTLTDPLGSPLVHLPGQFFTVLATVGGERLRRAYSPSRAPDGRSIRLTVKRVPGGKVSNHLHDHLREGDTVEVLGPSGSFTADPTSTGTPRHLVLLGGGSGITPLSAMAHAVLAGDSHARVTLVYGSRSLDDVIFHTELAALAETHPTRFHVCHVLTHAPDGWTGERGLMTADTVARTLDSVTMDSTTRYYVCGPEPMMAACLAVLQDRGVPGDRVLAERYTSPGARPREVMESTAQPLVIKLGDTVVRTVTRPGQTLLEAGLAAGAPMPFSCALGGCGACRVRLTRGAVSMEEPNCLTDTERSRGDVLACVARPTAPCSVEHAP